MGNVYKQFGGERDGRENGRQFWNGVASLFLGPCLDVATLPFSCYLPKRSRQTVMRTMSRLRTLSFPSIEISSMKLTVWGIPTCRLSLSLSLPWRLKLSDVERHPGDYRTPSFYPLIPIPFHFPLSCLWLYDVALRHVCIHRDYTLLYTLAGSCLSKTVTETMSVSVFSISSLLWSNITVEMVDWYHPTLSLHAVSIPSTMRLKWGGGCFRTKSSQMAKFVREHWAKTRTNTKLFLSICILC